ncbi:MAG: DinB family protein [Gemmatimonadaceae bacterium]
MEFQLDSAVAVLQRTPDTLRALLEALPEPWVHGTEGPKTFSAFDVVGHLIDGEETDWMTRSRIILAGGAVPFERYDRFRHWQRNVGRSLTSLLDEFAVLRSANLAEVRSWGELTQDQLRLPGMHPVLGPVTLRELLAAWVVHDLGHIAQTARVMAKQYRAEVGPWVPFLPVLTDHETPRS